MADLAESIAYVEQQIARYQLLLAALHDLEAKEAREAEDG